MKKTPRSAYVWSDEVDALVHLPDIEVDQAALQPIGFLAKHKSPKPKPKPKRRGR